MQALVRWPSCKPQRPTRPALLPSERSCRRPPARGAAPCSNNHPPAHQVPLLLQARRQAAAAVVDPEHPVVHAVRDEHQRAACLLKAAVWASHCRSETAGCVAVARTALHAAGAPPAPPLPPLARQLRLSSSRHGWPEVGWGCLPDLTLEQLLLNPSRWTSGRPAGVTGGAPAALPERQPAAPALDSMQANCSHPSPAASPTSAGGRMKPGEKAATWVNRSPFARPRERA